MNEFGTLLLPWWDERLEVLSHAKRKSVKSQKRATVDLEDDYLRF